MQQADMLPRQSLQDLANWGTAFSARPTEERELVQIYGKPLYDGAIAFSKWWRSLSIGQIQTLKGIDFPYWTITLASKLAKVPLKKLNNCLEALQKARLGVSKLSRWLNKFVGQEKLSFGRAITSEDWELIARSLDLDAIAIDAIRQQAVQMNGGSTQSVTTDLVIEILKEQGYPIERLLPKPRVKRYSLPEVALEVQKALQTKELELQEAQERILALELENIAWRNHSQLSEARDPAVEVTPIEPVNPQSAQFVVESNLVESQETLSDEVDVFDLTLWETFQVGEIVQTVDITPVESPGASPDVDSDFDPIVKAMPLKIHSLVRVVDKGDYRDYYGCTGIVKGRSTNAWWVRLDNGDYKQFPASALEQIPQEQASSESMFPLSELTWPKFSEVGRSRVRANLHPVAG
jgi:hypothetical protein